MANKMQDQLAFGIQMISVVICTYNRARLLEKTLNSIAQLHYPPVPWELIIVDNNCSDDTTQVAQSFAAHTQLRVRYLSEKKQGISHARNTGVKAAQGDIIAFTDDDVILDPQWLCEIHDTFAQFDCLGIGGKIVPLWLGQKPRWLEIDGPRPLMKAVLAFDVGKNSCDLNDTNAPFGANMSFRRFAFEKYGLFRTDLGRKRKSLMLGEDTEFCRRLLRRGERLVYAPGAIVYHPVAEERLRKRFFYSWYFNFGKYTARTTNYPPNSRTYFGVPRYMFKDLLIALLDWSFVSDPALRFRHTLHVYVILGQISGSRYAIRNAYPGLNRRAEKSLG